MEEYHVKAYSSDQGDLKVSVTLTRDGEWVCSLSYRGETLVSEQRFRYHTVHPPLSVAVTFLARVAGDNNVPLPPHERVRAHMWCSAKIREMQ